MWTRPFFVEAIDDVAEALEGLGRAGPFGLEQSPSLAAAVDQYFGLARCTALVKNDDGAGATSARRAASAVQELEGIVVCSVHRPLGISASIR